MMKLDKWQCLALADGIARVDAMLTISGEINVDRSLLRQWLARPGALDELARRIGSPDALDEAARDSLFDTNAPDHGTRKAHELRYAFADAVRRQYPRWFKVQERKAAKAAKLEARRRAAEHRRHEAEYVETQAADARLLDCIRADYFNLQTLVRIRDRDWRDGSRDEIRRGLDTPEARRQYRCARGLEWTCAGFGVYYVPRWSACRCRMKYAIKEAAGDTMLAFVEICNNPKFDAAIAEIETQPNDHRAYSDNPFVGRDPRLPVNEDAAKALLAKVKKGDYSFFTTTPKRKS